ncbi:MAG: LysR substrate-binding domain-containing protein [Pseudolysinimonas sp.]
MAEPFVVAFVPGVPPGKWARIWAERMPRVPLELRPASEAEALAALDGAAQMAFLRNASASDDMHVIPLYREQPVAVVARDSVLAAVDTLTLGDLRGFTRVEGQDAAAVELVAAAGGVALMPQSVARALSRKDVVARPVTDAPDTGIGLAWPTSAQHPLIETFIGIVRGRTANSSR